MRAALVSGLLGLLLGLLGGLWLRQAPVVPAEAPAPERRLASGAVVLRREPGGTPAPLPPDAPAGKLIRQQVVELQPIQRTPIELTLSEIQAPEGVRTVVWANGAVIAQGVDRSFPAPMPTREAPRWAVGPLWSPQAGLGVQGSRSWGVVDVTGAAWRDRVAVGVVVRF